VSASGDLLVGGVEVGTKLRVCADCDTMMVVSVADCGWVDSGIVDSRQARRSS
jgi:hypothetical protein